MKRIIYNISFDGVSTSTRNPPTTQPINAPTIGTRAVMAITMLIVRAYGIPNIVMTIKNNSPSIHASRH